MRMHYVARSGIGLDAIIACGDDQDDVTRRALKQARHPVVTPLLPGRTCANCGAALPEQASA